MARRDAHARKLELASRLELLDVGSYELVDLLGIGRRAAEAGQRGRDE